MKNIKYPNYTRKYKMSFYIIIFVLILFMPLAFIFSIAIDNYTQARTAAMIEGTSYSKETVVVNDKKEETEFYGLHRDRSRLYTPGIETKYYIYFNDVKLETDSAMYNQAEIGKKIDVYKSNKGHYYTYENEAKIDNLSYITQISLILFILIPVAEIIFAIYLFVFRKHFRNPYYSE